MRARCFTDSKFRDLALSIILASVVTVLAAFQQPPDRDKKESALRHASHQAQAQGLTSIGISTPVPYFLAVNSIDEALQSQAVLVVRVEDQMSVPSPDEDCVWTWYKMRIIHDLSRTQLSENTAPPNGILQIPANMLPLKENEVLVRSLGGSVTIEGVTVKSEHLHGGFSRDSTYLLFADLSKLGTTVSLSPSHYGEITLGPAGIFTIDSENRIHPLSARYADSPIAVDLQNRYGDSLDELSDALHGAKE